VTRADAAARALTDQYSPDVWPVDLDKVAGQLGLLIVRQPADADVHAMLIRRTGQEAVGLNDTRHQADQRFALAHAIGHHQLHARRELIIDVANRYRLGRLASVPTDPEANRFAAALLIPELVVRKMAAEADFTIGAQLVGLLAPRFEVSQVVMACRLMMLGIVLDA